MRLRLNCALIWLCLSCACATWAVSGAHCEAAPRNDYFSPHALAATDSPEPINDRPFVERRTTIPFFQLADDTYPVSQATFASTSFDSAGITNVIPASYAAGQGSCSAGCPCALAGADAYPSICQPAGCECCPKHSWEIFLGYDAWRGFSDGDWQNDGINVGLNYGTRLGQFSDWTGIGFQMGGSVGVYDWSGADYRLRNGAQAETQGFITYGLFRKATPTCRWNGAIVQDWMINNNFSVFAQTPTLEQWRWDIGYLLSDCDEVGLWGAYRGRGDSRNVPGFGTVAWRPIDRIDLFWHHKWMFGADTWLSTGVPERDRLAGGGSLGEYLVSASASIPLNQRITLYTLVSYMRPSAAPGPAAATEDAWNFTVGMAFYPGCNARTATVAGDCWSPLLPVASNGTFLVDSNQNY